MHKICYSGGKPRKQINFPPL